jgi:hypothetical protein
MCLTSIWVSRDVMTAVPNTDDSYPRLTGKQTVTGVG